MNIVRSIRGLALLSLASLGLVSTASAQSSVDVDITITGGGIAILNYYDAIEVELDTGDLAGLANPGCSLAGGVLECAEGASTGLLTSEAGGVFTADGGLSVTGGADPLENVTLDLDNVWAVRAIGGGVDTTVAVTLNDGTLTAVGAGTISIDSVLVYSVTQTAPAASISFPDPGLSAANAELGGVQLQLDLTGVTDEGTFSAAGDSYTITVTNS